MPDLPAPERTLSFVRTRVRLGLRRSYSSVVPALLISICAVSAYYFSVLVLRHNGPLFAATSAIIALGFSRDPRLRRVLEVGVGCTLGIAVGDLLLRWLGSGMLQAALVLFISILLARFLDSGAIFTTQLALQSLLVVLLPTPTGGPFTRSLDAVVGGCFALAATLLVPRDPRREPKGDLRHLLNELSTILRECAGALSENDSRTAWHALVRARKLQPKVDSMRAGLRSAAEVARLSPLYRRHQHEVANLSQSLEHVDYALRSSRILARRLISAIDNVALSETGTMRLADVISASAQAVDEMAAALTDPRPGSTGASLRHAREALAEIGLRLHPKALGITRMEGETVVLLFRTLMVDLLETARMDPHEARALLPEL